MSTQKDNKWLGPRFAETLDELICRAINTTKPRFDLEKFKQNYPKEFQILLSRAAGGATTGQPNIWAIFFKKFTAAAVLVIGLAIGALMGRDTWQSPAIQSVGKSQMAQVKPIVIYHLDYLTDAPKGTLADTYLTLVSATNEWER